MTYYDILLNRYRKKYGCEPWDADADNENRITVKKLKDGVFLMDDDGCATGYIVVGSRKAVVIDTMTGFYDAAEAVRSVTDKPLMVINTHGHCDHIFGNIYFDEAYIDPLDEDIARIEASNPDFGRFRESRGLKMPPFRYINDGDIIDIGGRTVEVISLPGHSAGSILLLLREDRILFTGDAINRHLWIQFENCSSPDECLGNLEKVMYLRDKADYILHGHASGFEPVTLIDELYEGLREVCRGENAGDKEYECFGGTAMSHSFAEGRSAIVYPMGYIGRIK